MHYSDFSSKFRLLLCLMIIDCCGNASFIPPAFQLLMPAVKRTSCLFVILDIFCSNKKTLYTYFGCICYIGQHRGNGKISWRKTMS